jgi:hypothetical protein
MKHFSHIKEIKIKTNDKYVLMKYNNYNKYVMAAS